MEWREGAKTRGVVRGNSRNGVMAEITSYKHRKHKATLTREEQRGECVRLKILDGLTLRQIGNRLGVSYQTVKRRLDEAREEWAAESQKTVEYHRAKNTKRLEHLLHEALEGLRRSQIEQTRSKVRKHNGAGDGAETTTSEVEKRKMVGDPAWIAQAQGIIDKLVRLNGGYPPEQVQVSGTIGVGVFDALKAAEAGAPEIVDAKFTAIDDQSGNDESGSGGGNGDGNGHSGGNGDPPSAGSGIAETGDTADDGG